MNPYDIDFEKLVDSKEVTDGKELLKLKLNTAFLKAIANLDSQEVIELTGLDKSDLSRLRSFGLKRFSIDRIINLLDRLGFSTEVKVKKKVAG